MKTSDIKHAIRAAGTTQAEIARRLEKSEAAVSFVISGHSRSKAIAEEISRVTGLSIEELWPGAYQDKAA